MVMSTDPGYKLIRDIPPHGPYLLQRVTKSGMAVLGGRRNTATAVAPRHLALHEEPTHSTEDNPYYYKHAPGDPICECAFARIWLSWPLECRNCGRIVRSTLKAPLHGPADPDTD